MLKNTFILLLIAFFSLSLTTTTFAFEQDSLTSTEGLQFESSPDTTPIVEAVPDDLAFSDAPDTTLSQDSSKLDKAATNIPAGNSETGRNPFGVFLSLD